MVSAPSNPHPSSRDEPASVSPSETPRGGPSPSPGPPMGRAVSRGVLEPRVPAAPAAGGGCLGLPPLGAGRERREGGAWVAAAVRREAASGLRSSSPASRGRDASQVLTDGGDVPRGVRVRASGVSAAWGAVGWGVNPPTAAAWHVTWASLSVLSVSLSHRLPVPNSATSRLTQFPHLYDGADESTCLKGLLCNVLRTLPGAE